MGVSRTKFLRMKIKKEFKNMIKNAKDGNEKVNDNVHHFLEKLDSKLDFQTKFSNKFAHNKLVKNVNHYAGKFMTYAGKSIPTEEDVASDFDF